MGPLVEDALQHMAAELEDDALLVVDPDHMRTRALPLQQR
jgi:hypothetical protein